MFIRMFLLICLSFLVSCSMATPNLRIVNGETRMSLTQSAPISRGADISPDGKYLLTGGMNGFSYWDISKGTLIKQYRAELPQIVGTMLTTGLIPVAFSGGGKYALSGGEELILWDLSTGQRIRKIGSDQAETISVTRDGRRVLTNVTSEWPFFKDDKMFIHDAISGEKINEWSAFASGGIIALSPDGKYAMSTGGGGRKSVSSDRGMIHLWDVASGEDVHSFAGTGDKKDFMQAVLAMAFSADSKYALSGGTDGSLRVWDVLSGSEIKTIQAHTGVVGTKAVAFSPDGKLILSVGGSDGLAKIWDLSSGSLVREFMVSDDRFVGVRRLGGIINGWVSFTPDGRRIIFMGSDASFRIFDVKTGEEVASLVLFEDGEWLVVTSEGYYNASEKGAKYLKVRYAGIDFSVDQFYDVFYRPDIVSAKLSGLDVSGLASLNMKDASRNPPPFVEFTTAPSDTRETGAKVCYRAKSSGGGIGEVRLFHNGKLIQSDGYYRETAKSEAPEQLAAINGKAIYENMRSVSVKLRGGTAPLTGKPKGDIFEECREVEIVAGENEVSVSAFNSDNTIQSALKTVKFKAALEPENPHLYILSVGIDRYKDKAADLRYAVKDASDIEQKLLKQSASLYKPRNIHNELLADSQAVKSNILRKISELSKVIKPSDSFIMFVAGHGVLIQNQYYVLTHDYDGIMSEQGMISSNEIVEMSKKIKSLSQLLIFDTCHAGGVDTIVSGLYDARMSVLAKKMGLHIYASASDRQSAIDGYKGNGLFTYTLLSGLNNNREADRNKEGKVTIVGLGEYSRRATTGISKEIGHSQTPIIINFGKDSPIYKLQ